MKSAFLLLLWIPMIVIGHLLSAILFKNGSLAYYAFFLIWPLANFYLAYRLCQKNGQILVIRLVTFFIFECAVLAIILLFWG
jgi:hypothetical protein